MVLYIYILVNVAQSESFLIEHTELEQNIGT